MPSPSVGLVAARLLDVKPEKEIMRDWYAQALLIPGTENLHHHLELLSQGKDRKEPRSVSLVKRPVSLRSVVTRHLLIIITDDAGFCRMSRFLNPQAPGVP